MLESDKPDTSTTEPADEATTAATKAAPRKRAKKAAPAAPAADDAAAPRKRPAKKAAKSPAEPPAADADVPAKATRKRAAKKAAPEAGAPDESGAKAPALAAPSVLFVPPAATTAPARPRRGAKALAGPPTIEPAPGTADITVAEDAEDHTAEPDDVREAAVEEATGARRRRRRGRRGRGGGSNRAAQAADGDESSDDVAVEAAEPVDATAGDVDESDESDDGAEGTATHRRRRRRRSGGGAGTDLAEDDPPNTVVHVRAARDKSEDDGVRGVKGSTRLEAKRQRRKDGRDTSRRRPPILTEAEFLARREAVDRVMAVRQNGDRTQIAVLEDNVLVEHYVTRASATSYVGNVYLGRVQNVLPSMEAAFVDIGKGRNGVLYAGEVNWDAAGLEGKSRAIESALKSGDVVLVQVTKDPIGHKGARLTSQVSLPGRFLVYVPGGGMTGISRKLPDTERHRLKSILKKIVPEDAGVIVRTAAEGASEEELTRDVERLKSQWEKIAKKAEKTSAAPTLLHGEPDLAIRVVRDVFNEDFKKLVVHGDDAWKTVSDYVDGVAPDLADRVSRHTADTDLFHDLRVDEQLMKALDRKVYLPSGGSLVIDRTEAMTVIDVNTGKFVGSGGNLEQTVTRNNIEAAEEIVRQLRLRDVGGIVVIDFIDMVLESNRDLVLRRLTECLGRDRTKHQVAEVTSLGLVQMTRKRVGEGLLEAFSEPCETCKGRGVVVHSEPVDKPVSESADSEDTPKAKRKRGGTKKSAAEPTTEELAAAEEQRRIALAAISAIHRAAHPEEDGVASGDDAVDAAAEVVANVLDVEEAGEAEVEAEPLEAEPLEAEPVEAVEPAQVGAAAEPAAAAEPSVERKAPRRRRAASRPAGPPVTAAH
jgi:ribonuclease E